MRSDEFGLLFPEAGRILLTGTGKQLVERIGVEAVREIVLNVMLGENLRDKTEPLTRQRITLTSAALLMFFIQGWTQTENFTDQLSDLASQTISSRGISKVDKSPAYWVLGLTEKQMQNVLRGKKERLEDYITEFETALSNSVERCLNDYGELELAVLSNDGSEEKRVQLSWRDFVRLTTAIGSQTLAIRGSDKSMYGKLFEKLILGSALSVLGFQRVDRHINTRNSRVFWLSDSTGDRESDATLIYQPGKVARFDIGFIGKGNSEISKDKLSRFERQIEISGVNHDSATFIIVDRLPEKSRKTQEVAERLEAELIQMQWQHWVKFLAQRLGERMGFEHELQTMPEHEIANYLRTKLSDLPIETFLSSVSLTEVQENI